LLYPDSEKAGADTTKSTKVMSLHLILLEDTKSTSNITMPRDIRKISLIRSKRAPAKKRGRRRLTHKRITTIGDTHPQTLNLSQMSLSIIK
jgi:hypothetical protein